MCGMQELWLIFTYNLLPYKKKLMEFGKSRV